MAFSKITSELIQCCMTNDLNTMKTLINSGKVTFDGKDAGKFLLHVEKVMTGAHKKGTDDWNLDIQPADWLKNKEATAYDFYSGNGNQPCMSLVVEELEDGVWIEVLK